MYLLQPFDTPILRRKDRCKCNLRKHDGFSWSKNTFVGAYIEMLSNLVTYSNIRMDCTSEDQMSTLFQNLVLWTKRFQTGFFPLDVGGYMVRAWHFFFFFLGGGGIKNASSRRLPGPKFKNIYIHIYIYTPFSWNKTFQPFVLFSWEKFF